MGDDDEPPDLSQAMAAVIPALPQRRVFVHNGDKTDHQEWYAGRDLCSFPSPFRAIICGRPNSGKTAWVHELISRGEPAYDKVVVVHCDLKSKDYDDYEPEMLKEIPPPDDPRWGATITGKDGKQRRERTICVLDDIDFGGLSKEQQSHLDRLISYVSTHKHVSVICCAQDAFRIPPSTRRMANVFILFRGLDSSSMKALASRIGYKVDQFMGLFEQHVKDNHQALVFDLTDGTPAPLRLDGFEVLSAPATAQQITRKRKTRA